MSPNQTNILVQLLKPTIRNNPLLRAGRPSGFTLIELLYEEWRKLAVSRLVRGGESNAATHFAPCPLVDLICRLVLDTMRMPSECP